MTAVDEPCDYCGGWGLPGDDECDECRRPTATLDDRRGRCYELSYTFMLTEDRPNLRLVHGHSKMMDGPVPIPHAWVTYESDGVTMGFDPVLDVELPLDAFGQSVGSVEVVSYSKSEAVSLATTSKNSGPWHDEWAALRPPLSPEDQKHLADFQAMLSAKATEYSAAHPEVSS